MKKQERQKAIRVKLVTDKKVYVSELAKELSVKTRTIRNDLNELSQNSLFSLFHGGAQIKSAPDESLFEQSFTNTILNGFKSHREEIVSVSTHAKQNSYIDDSIYILGSFNIDIVSETTTFPQIGQTIRASATRFYAGGKGTNQAVAAAKINNNVHLTVKLGADEFSKKAKRYLTNTEISSFSFSQTAQKQQTLRPAPPQTQLPAPASPSYSPKPASPTAPIPPRISPAQELLSKKRAVSAAARRKPYCRRQPQQRTPRAECAHIPL